jgi:hypothetical protein
MKSRRKFIQAVPFAAAAVLAACGGKPPEPTAAPAPAPAPEPAPTAPPPVEPVAMEPAAAVDPSSLPVLDPEEVTAKALGYVTDATTVDASKWPTWVAGNVCSGCTLYSGVAGAATGPCSLFPGKQVSAIGWCSGFIKKPA